MSDQQPAPPDTGTGTGFKIKLGGLGAAKPGSAPIAKTSIAALAGIKKAPVTSSAQPQSSVPRQPIVIAPVPVAPRPSAPIVIDDAKDAPPCNIDVGAFCHNCGITTEVFWNAMVANGWRYVMVVMMLMSEDNHHRR